jgi:Raf kinase inhibitor-like YbhB/YbcL family protein
MPLAPRAIMRNPYLTALLFVAVAPAILLAQPSGTKRPPPVSLDVNSPAFTAGKEIPAQYTCDGNETSPPLVWSEVPADTRSIAVLVDEPDAPKGAFTHWLVVGLPAATSVLNDGAALPAAAVVSKNSKGVVGYAGPCPASGTHRYHFRVFALDMPLTTQLTRAQFLKTIAGHVIARGDLVGTYSKK